MIYASLMIIRIFKCGVGEVAISINKDLVSNVSGLENLKDFNVDAEIFQRHMRATSTLR